MSFDIKTLKSLTPTAALILIAFFLLSVLTGMIPTPLMQGLQAVGTITDEHETIIPILEDLRYFDKIDCLRKSTTPDERAECEPKRK